MTDHMVYQPTTIEAADTCADSSCSSTTTGRGARRRLRTCRIIQPYSR